MAGIQFILGRSGTGKTRRCIDRICRALAEGEKRPLILLVPEQATYQAERSILSHPDVRGFSNLRVLSFERLAFLLTGGTGDTTELSSTARQMALHKILLDLSGQMRLYRGDLLRSGLAAKMAGLLSDLQAADCTSRQIQRMAEELAARQGDELAAAKWADIAAVFTAYEAFFETHRERFANPDTHLSRCRSLVEHAQALHGALLWVDGFSGFTAAEEHLLAELLKVCEQAQIALCLDPATIDTDNDDEDKLDPCSLFAAAEQTYCRLLRIVRACGLPVSAAERLQTPLRFQSAPALAALEENLAAGQTVRSASCGDAIAAAACVNLRKETQWAARQIRRLVQHEGYRYRDIAVVLPEMETYPHYVQSAFGPYEIPYFLDRPRNMKTHPLAELVGAAMQAAMSGLTLSDVLSFLKCGLAGVAGEQMDRLENYARAYDVQGDEWTQPQPWTFAPAEEKAGEIEMDTLRRQVIRPLAAFREALTGAAEITAADFARAIWTLLETLNAGAALADWAQHDPTDQQYGHRQAYTKLVELIEQLCGIFEHVRLPAQGWCSILSDAMATLTIKFIPPTLDQVLVGSVERSRHPDIKAIFLLGAVQKNFPVPVAGEGLLGEQDYAAAKRGKIELPDPYELQLSHRPYLSYIALTRACRRIFLSYPMLDEKGAAVVPWSGFQSLREMFDDFDVRPASAAPARADAVCTVQELSQWLCAALGRDRAGSTATEQAALVLEGLRQSDDAVLTLSAERVTAALTHENTAAIHPAIARKFTEIPMVTSVSRLGTFAACPYQYFAKYALRLQRRQTLRFEPVDIGSFYHHVLEKMYYLLKSAGTDWAEASPETLDATCRSAIDQVLTEDARLANFVRRKAHHRYILQSAMETLRAFVPGLAQLCRAGVFRQAGAELQFGPEQTARVVLKPAPDRPVYLRGQIDRVDAAKIDGRLAAVVFDFKRTPRSACFSHIYHGLDLQLLVYLLALEQLTLDGEPMQAVGAFYLPIENGLRKQGLSQCQTERQTGCRAKGLFCGDFAFDLHADAAKNSRFFNFYVDKNSQPYGHYNAWSGALRPEDFRTLLDFSQKTIGRLATTLADGRFDISPYRLGRQSPCGYCDYRAVCRFDWQINEYNILEPCTKEEALIKMRQL